MRTPTLFREYKVNELHLIFWLLPALYWAYKGQGSLATFILSLLVSGATAFPRIADA